jgi:hypothetical protein
MPQKKSASPKAKTRPGGANSFNWQLNASTGSYHAKVDEDTKLIRWGHSPSTYVYEARRGDHRASGTSPKMALDELRKAIRRGPPRDWRDKR